MCFRHTRATCLQSLELGLGSHVQNPEIEESKGKYSLQSEVILPTTTSSSSLGGPSGAHPGVLLSGVLYPLIFCLTHCFPCLIPRPSTFFGYQALLRCSVVIATTCLLTASPQSRWPGVEGREESGSFPSSVRGPRELLSAPTSARAAG